MISSLPVIVPHDAHTLWFQSSQASPPTFAGDSPHASINNQQQQRRSHSSATSSAQSRSLLAALNADEAALNQRKHNIRRFGATWIRPPGVSKTFQAMVDEQIERAEQEAISLREQAREEQERMMRAEEDAQHSNIPGVEGAMDVDGTMEGTDDVDVDGMDRDLDEDVPEADGDDDELDGSDDIDSDEGFGNADLDADVPEAGSYQHTDTEVEGESSDEDRNTGHGPVVVQDIRESIGPLLSSGGGGNSRNTEAAVLSSPTVASRGPRRAQR